MMSLNKWYVVLRVVITTLILLTLSILTVDVINYNLEFYFIPSLMLSSFLVAMLIFYLIVIIKRMLKYRKYKKEGLTVEQYKEDIKNRRMKYVKPKVVIGLFGIFILAMLLRDSVGVTGKLTEIKEGIDIDDYAVLECSNLIDNGICGVVDVDTEDMYVVYFNEDKEYGYKKPGSMFQSLE